MVRRKLPNLLFGAVAAAALLAVPAAAQSPAAALPAQLRDCVASMAADCIPLFAAEAVRAAQVIPEAKMRDLRLRTIGLQQVHLHDFTGAAATVELIADPSVRVIVMTALAEEQAADGRFEAARESAEAAARLEESEWPFVALARGLARNQSIDEALQVAAALGSAEVRSEARLRVADKLATLGDFPAALQTARLIEEPGRRDKALAGIVGRQAMTGDLAEARRVAETIDPPALRDPLLHIIATKVMEQGDADDALALAAGIEDEKFAQRAWGTFANLYARTGAYDQAFAALDHLPPGRARDDALAGVAAEQAERGDLMAAIETAQAFADRQRAVMTLMAIAKQQGAADDALLAAALDILKETPLAEDDFAVLGVVVATLAEVRSVDEASALADGIADPAARSYAFVTLASWQSESGDAAAAFETSRRIAKEAQRVPLQAAVAYAMIGSGATAEGRALLPGLTEDVRRLQDPWVRGYALRYIAAALVATGQAEAALALLPEVPQETNFRDEVRLAIAEEQAAVGDLEGGRRTAEGLSQESHRFFSMRALLDAGLERGRIDQALLLVEALDDPLLRSQLFMELVSIAEEARSGR